MYESTNVGRVISQPADNLPDSASCILKSSHTEESQGTQPSQPGGGDSSDEGNDAQLRTTAALGQRTGTAGQALSPRVTAASPAPAILLHHSPAWAEIPIFPLESPPLPAWSHAMNMPDRPAGTMDVQEAQIDQLCTD